MLIVPEETELTLPYWQGARERKLRLQRCSSCGHTWHPPLPVCPRCNDTGPSWYAARGTGRVHSFTVVHRAAHPAFTERVPYVVVVAELDEGPLVVGNLFGTRHDAVTVGQGLHVVFEEIAEGVVLPQFAVSGT